MNYLTNDLKFSYNFRKRKTQNSYYVIGTRKI